MRLPKNTRPLLSIALFLALLQSRSAVAQSSVVLQSELALARAWGINPGAIDGVEDSAFVTALRTVQLRARIPVTGRLDDTTLAVIMSDPINVEICVSVSSNLPLSQCLSLFGPPAVPARSSSSDPCDEGYRACVAGCPNIVREQYGGNRSFPISQTAVSSDCEDSCDEGRDECQNEEDLEDRCEEFDDECRSSCDGGMVFVATISGYLNFTDYQDNCRTACRDGERACERFH
jgi:hypothetical protein